MKSLEVEPGLGARFKLTAHSFPDFEFIPLVTLCLQLVLKLCQEIADLALGRSFTNHKDR